MRSFKTENNYDALITENQLGEFRYYCGYIKIPKEYINLFKINKKDFYLESDVYGGVTFSDYMEINDELSYYVGFDCAHYDDRINKKNITFVKNECNKLSTEIDNYIKSNCKGE